MAVSVWAAVGSGAVACSGAANRQDPGGGVVVESSLLGRGLGAPARPLEAKQRQRLLYLLS